MPDLYRDPVTGRMSPVRRVRTTEDVYLEDDSPAATIAELRARISELERRGA